MRIFIDFDKTIDLEIDLVALDQILRMKNLLLIQLENKEVQVVETRFKKIAIAKNKAMQLESVSKKLKDNLQHNMEVIKN